MVKWSVPAKKDLKQIHDYISKDSRYFARNVIRKIIARTETLVGQPGIGRIVPEIDDQDIRELFLYSYRIIYEIAETGIVILAIIHGKRDFNSAWDKKTHQ